MKKKAIPIALTLSMLIGTCAFAEGNINNASNINNEQITSLSIGESESDVVLTALSLGIIDSEDLDLTEDITRERFCEYVYNMLNSVKELPQAKLFKNPFDDVSNYKINSLSFIGVISGKSENIFAPNDKLTREEAAVILYRSAVYAEAELPAAKVDMTYSDNSDISPWAVSAVYSLKLSGILKDTDDGFKPQSAMTTQQALTSVMSLYSLIKK